MKKIKRLPLLLFLFFIPGCWDYQSMDNTYYIYSLGVDYKEGNYLVYTQLLNLSVLSATSEKGNSGNTDEAWIGIGKGSTILSAIDQIQFSLENNVDWGHLNSIIFTESALKHGVRDIFELLTRYYKSRLTHWIFATDQPLESIFRSLPIIFKTPYYSLIGNPMHYYNHSSYIKPIRSYQFMQLTHEPGKTVLIPKLNQKQVWSGIKEKQLTSLHIDGVFPTTNYRSTSKYSLATLLGLRWLEPDTRKTKLYLRKNGKEAVQLDCYNPNHSIRSKVIHENIKFDIYTEPKCRIMEMQLPLTEDEIRRLAKRQIEKQIAETYQVGLKQNIDLYSLSYVFYYDYPEQWHRLAKKNKMRLTHSSIQSIQAKPKIINSGTRKVKDHSKKKR